MPEEKTLKEEALEMLQKIKDEHMIFYVHGTIKAALKQQEEEVQGKL